MNFLVHTTSWSLRYSDHFLLLQFFFKSPVNLLLALVILVWPGWIWADGLKMNRLGEDSQAFYSKTEAYKVCQISQWSNFCMDFKMTQIKRTLIWHCSTKGSSTCKITEFFFLSHCSYLRIIKGWTRFFPKTITILFNAFIHVLLMLKHFFKWLLFLLI